ncbi:DUF4268 domain-containing protein [Aquimarina agarivorans]|uniref:DUF4268 domain-containing protein n=1 Tax=Aquimarina agarivorans TaxID=980584 RepID=UPI000248F5A4|nr:DUF4268 domain-containing protein [Aquimarina agarivorans]
MKLSNLKKIDLRTYWKHEALDFTRWLAKEENIQLLSDEIGISLIDVKVEEATGRYSVDILAKDEDSERRVIIENQLEITDHKHLGQLITYASGFNASVIIWIVKEAREEHQKAIEWLNNSTNAQLSFILIQMELWQIDDSPFAPKFHILVQPNDWAKQLQNSSHESKELTDTKLTQLEFWTQFIRYTKDNNTSLRIGRKPRAQHWYNISFGTSLGHIVLTINTQKNDIACSIYIPDAIDLFNRFSDNKEAIEKELALTLDWEELEGKKATRITKGYKANISEQESWNDYFNWLQNIAEKFSKVFPKYFN